MEVVEENNKMVAKTDAQRSREYRERQKAKKIIQLLRENVDRRQSTSTKTSAEYLKEYRRKKRLGNQSSQLTSLLAKDYSNAKKKKTGDVHHLPKTEKLGSQIGFQASQLTYKLVVVDCQSGLLASNECPEILQRNSFQAPYKQHNDCAQPQAIYYHDTEILSDGNCFFFSVIKIMNLALSPVQIRQQLLASPFINSCINPNGARSILESETEYAEMDCIEIFARVYNQNVCVHNHYVNTKTGREERQFLHFKINNSQTFLHLHLCNLHFTPLMETTAMIVDYRLDEKNDVADNEASDNVNEATPYMDINNVAIPIYTKYHEHASGHLKFYNIFKSNTFGHSCAVCDRLWWKSDLKKSTDVHDKILRMILPNYVCGNAVEICGSCKNNLDKGKIPILAVYNGFSFPAIPRHLPKLNLMEQRLISPKIPFMQIRRFRHVHGQYGIYGQIINVPVEVNTMVNQLPRNIEDDDCFYARIEKKLIHKTSYIHGLINKENIKQWLSYLVKTPLYVHENITINEHLLNSYGVDTELVINDINEHIAIVDNLTAQHQTLMWNEDKMLHMAPGKRSIPNSILFNENAEELSFPTIYGGQFRTHRDGCNFTSFMQVTSELRRTDRRAVDPQHLLYMAAKTMRQRVSSYFTDALKHGGFDTKITKEDLQSEDDINNFIETNLGFLRCIPNSAWYWAVRKQDLFAIIRQFGAPTAFMTLSANEAGWPDLLKLLYKLKNNGAEIDDESLSEMSYVQKAQLVNEDAVTCAIYFHKLVLCLLKILQSKKGSPFGKYRVKDYFKRIEFQHRGSPRAHILLWLDNAPEDLLNNCKSFTDMADTLVSVSESEASGNIELQTHKHTFTCYKKMAPNKNDNCRFGAPFLPSRNTITLMPMKDTDSDYCVEKFKEYKKHYASLKMNLENNNYDNFDHFYAENNIVSDKHYYDIIRAGIVRPKLLYRRTPSEKWHNTFNPFVFHCLKSNMDIQIIQDEYDCAAYVVEYVNKHDKGVSNLQRLIIQAMNENAEFDIVDIIKKFSIDLLHAVEMPAQEAAWYLLREPMAKSSAVTAYIPTICPTERQKISKTSSDLDDNCTSVLKENWFDMYEKRPENLENLTLAQFVANYNNKRNGEYCKREASRVIRYRNYDMANNFNHYRREMVLLHIPFRSENNDVLAENKFIQIYEDNKDLIRERKKELESNVDIDKILEICRQLGREADEDEKRNEMNDMFEAGPYGRPLDDNSVVNADVQHATVRKLGSVVEKGENLMDTEQFNDLMRSTNSEQLMHIKSHVQNLDQQPFEIFFSGSAGSGKTFLIKVIMEVYDRYSDTDGYCNGYIACASSGKDDVAIEGATVYTALVISISKLLRLSSELLLYRSLFEYVKVLIIDGINIVGAKLLAKMDLRLKQVTGSYNADFGGIDVILVGDLRRAPPVKATSTHKPVKTRMLGPHLWRSLKFLQLTQVMRQGNGEFSSILKKIGNGEVLEDIEFELIESRFFKIEESPRLCPHGDVKPSNVNYDNGENKLSKNDETDPPPPDIFSVTIKSEIEPSPFDLVKVEPGSDEESFDEFATVRSRFYKDREVNNTYETFISNNKAKCDQESDANSSKVNYDNGENKVDVVENTDPFPPDIFPVTIKSEPSSEKVDECTVNNKAKFDKESDPKSSNVNYDNGENKLYNSNCDFNGLKRKKRPFSKTEKTMIWNMYQSMRNATPSASYNDISKAIASSVGIHWVSVCRIMKEKNNNNGILKSPKKTKMRMKIVDILDDFTKCAIRRIVHNFFSRNEIPTLDKILKKISEDGTLGTFKRSTLNKILKNIGFKNNKRGRNSLLLDRDDIFFWRRNYLRAIKHARGNRQKIYYLDETWVNEGHTTSRVWEDTTVKSRRDALINGLTTDLKNPSGKGKRLIITHIGSEDGFVDGGLHVIESKKQGDYHKDMNAEVFENWFELILDKLDDNCVIVMDNAPYHSRKTQEIPTEKNKKQEIIDWLEEKNITFDEDLLKRELLNIVKQHKQRYEARVVDEMAKAKNKTVLRLPPYHCDLNPIELIWAQVKGKVAAENTTYKMAELRNLLNNAIQNINAQKWQNCIKHVQEIVEPEMNAMDRNVEIMTDNLIINLQNDSSDTSSDSD